MEQIREWMDRIGTAVDIAGVAVIIIGMSVATWRFLVHSRKAEASYVRFRQDVGRAILLGLEFLVAGDIIRTIVVAPTLENVGTLGAIILIRTFLSISLQVELEGRWPWQKKQPEDDRTRTSDPDKNVS